MFLLERPENGLVRFPPQKTGLGGVPGRETIRPVKATFQGNVNTDADRKTAAAGTRRQRAIRAAVTEGPGPPPAQEVRESA